MDQKPISIRISVRGDIAFCMHDWYLLYKLMSHKGVQYLRYGPCVTDPFNPRFWSSTIEADGVISFITGLQSYNAYMEQYDTQHHGLSCYSRNFPF